MKIKESISTFKSAFWVCLSALFLSWLIFPELFLQGKISFISWDDYLVDYQSIFALTGFFYQGGIQLWDFFGQMPHMFFWVTHGMFRVPNLLTSISFVLLSPFSDNSAQLFNHLFALVYLGSLLIIRTIGIFLLLKRITNDKWILWPCTVIFAVLCCPPAFMIGVFYQSFIPLLMYFVLSFFLTWRVIYLGMGALFILLSFSQGMIHTCYMYLGVNLLMVSCAVYSLCVHTQKWQHCREFLKKNAKVLWRGALVLFIFGMVILSPYVYMQLFCLKDFAFNQDHSRLSGMWSVAHYFHALALDQSPPADFFRRMLDFTFLPGRSFFLGYMIFFLSGLAWAMSKDHRKWIFISAILLVWFLNFPRDTFSIGLIGHWVNVLTNPFKSLVRSYQTALNTIFAYLLMPLVIMGLEVLKGLVRGETVEYKRLRWFAVFGVFFIVNGCSYQTAIVKMYIVLSLIISLAGLALLTVSRGNVVMKRTAKFFFMFLILMDLSLGAWQMKHFMATSQRLRPHFVNQLPLQTGLVGLDAHNPKVFPFVEHSDSFTFTEQAYLWSLGDISSNFFRIFNREINFRPEENFTPRHMSFRQWAHDPSMREFISQNDQLFFFARYGVKAGQGTFEDIINRHFARDVMMVDGIEPSLNAGIPTRIERLSTGEDQWFNITEDMSDPATGWEYKDGMMVWDFPLKWKVPEFLATDIFTHDHWVKFFIQTADGKYVELAPAQGQLIKPMTFDVQNIKEGKVYVALPGGMAFTGLKGILLLKARDASGITSVWRHHSDETGINFQAPADGWLGIQYPYDSKWRINVDDKPVQFYRADKSFIGCPITQGEHKILIRYWPDSWLRFGLPISIILTSVLFIVLIIYALRDASKIHND